MPKPISKANAPHYSWGAGCDGWRLADGAGLSVIHERMPPGTAEVCHWHRTARQFFFVLSGRLAMEVAGLSHCLEAGEGIEIEPGSPHQARNDSESDVEFLVISQPSTADDRHPVAAEALLPSRRP